jgi:hypothetical protein
MRHFASPAFWDAYQRLPEHIRNLADKTYVLLRNDPQHPLLQLKKVGRYWSVRVGARHRALVTDVDEGLLWFWIGSHADYDKLLGRS